MRSVALCLLFAMRYMGRSSSLARSLAIRRGGESPYDMPDATHIYSTFRRVYIQLKAIFSIIIIIIWVKFIVVLFKYNKLTRQTMNLTQK